MYQFWYNYVKPKYGKKAKLCYIDTNSFIVYIMSDDIYKDIGEDFESTITFIISWDFLMFYQIFFHHKRNEAWLLLINMIYTSCLTSCRMTYILGSKEIIKYHEFV